MSDDFIAVILAAGKGTRMKAKKINKVMYLLAGKPMINYTINLLKKVNQFKKIIIVVGFAKKSITDYLGHKYIYVMQRKRLGTAHAVKVALSLIPTNTCHVFVINAHDSAFYPSKVISNLINLHLKENGDLTFLTVDMKKPNFARVIRGAKGQILGIVEQQNLSTNQVKIKEINCGCYCFKTGFLKKYLQKVTRNEVSREYYITELIEIGVKNNCQILAYKMDKEEYFQGINTKIQLMEAEIKMKKKQLYDT